MTQKFVHFSKNGNFKCMWILFMHGSTWDVAILPIIVDINYAIIFVRF